MKRNNSNNIIISKETSEEIAYDLFAYLNNDLDIEITSLQSILLTDFITEKLGRHYYNQGVTDSIDLMKDKTDDLYLIMKDKN